MVEYHFHDAEPVLKYLLVSVGSSLILFISLLMCAKKSKSYGEPTSANIRKESHGVVIPVHEEPIEAVPDFIFESTPEDIKVTVKNGSCTKTAILPNTKQPLRKVLSCVDTNIEKIEEKENSVSNQSVSPYATVTTNENGPLIFECSGNSDSGNGIYAKVKDVPVREETAYAVVEIKDKNYDFVNGNLVRRKVVIVDEETEKSFSETTSPYDTPNCIPIPIGEEMENSGASGIYESVSDSNKQGNLEPLSRTSTNDSDLYDSCGPPLIDSNKQGNLEPLSRKSTNDSDLYDSCGPASIDNIKQGNLEPLSRKSTNGNDLYDSCGPAPIVNHVDHSHDMNRGNNITDRISNVVTSNDDDVKYDSFKRHSQKTQDVPRRESSKEVLYRPSQKTQVDVPRRGSCKDVLDEPNKCEKKEQEKPSKISRLLKFPQSSRKSKKTEENHIITDKPTSHTSTKDIPVNNVDTNEDKAPPPPSVDKLKHISAHRKGQHSISDKSYSPESSLGGPSPTGSPRILTNSMNNQPIFVYNDREPSVDTGVLHTQQELHVSHRPRMSEGNIPVHNLHGETFLKTQNSLPGVTTQVCDIFVNNSTENQVHIIVEKSINTNDINSEVTRDSLKSEPDYAEIETRGRSENGVNIPPVVVKEYNCEVSKGYTKIDYGNKSDPLEVLGEGDYGVGKDYALIDFKKKEEDRRIKNLYAAVDFSLKKPHIDEVESPPTNSVMYEGTYDIIPVLDTNSEAVPQKELCGEFGTTRNN